MTEPDCMIPDGDEPCLGYQELRHRVVELERISGYSDYTRLNPERLMTFEAYLKRQAELAIIAALR